jgi:branched-chain amino acid transport system permease protein
VSGFLQLVVMGLMEGGLYALVGAAVVLVYKATQVVSLAHGQILAFGAFFFYLFYEPLSFPLLIALLLSFLISGIIGFMIDRITLRPLIGQPLFTAFLVTFAIFMVFDGIFQLVLKGSSRSLPPFIPREVFHLGQINIPQGQLFSFIAALVIFALLGFMFQYSKVGLGMRATAENHQLAQSTGISVKRIFSIIWVLSAIVAAISGIAIANVMDIYYSLPYIGIKGLTVALFGGLESLPGALLGGLILGIFENVSAGYLDPIVGGGVKEVAAYVLLLFILIVRPYGLMGLIRIERI